MKKWFPKITSKKGMTTKAQITAAKLPNPEDEKETYAARGIVYANKYFKSFIAKK